MIKATQERAVDADEDDCEIEVLRRWRQCGIEPQISEKRMIAGKARSRKKGPWMRTKMIA